MVFAAHNAALLSKCENDSVRTNYDEKWRENARSLLVDLSRAFCMSFMHSRLMEC